MSSIFLIDITHFGEYWSNLAFLIHYSFYRITSWSILAANLKCLLSSKTIFFMKWLILIAKHGKKSVGLVTGLPKIWFARPFLNVPPTSLAFKRRRQISLWIRVSFFPEEHLSKRDRQTHFFIRFKRRLDLTYYKVSHTCFILIF